MTATVSFVLAAGLLLVGVLALLSWPLLRRPAEGRDAKGERRAANLAIYRDQLSELERERAIGALSEADFVSVRQELQRRLLDEEEEGDGVAAAPVAATVCSARKTVLFLVVFVPLAAIAGYLSLGTPQALAPESTAHAMDAAGMAEIDGMLDRLKARLAAHPDDAPGWLMLARSNRTLGRYAEAAAAYGRAGALVDGDPALLADYAEVLARGTGGFDDASRRLIARALALDPDASHALFLAGMAASERGEDAAVVEHWGRLLRQLDPASEEARALEAAVREARSRVQPPGKTTSR